MISSDYYQRSTEQVLDDLKTSPDGLASQEAQARLSQYGPNEISQKNQISIGKILLRQFQSLLIYILLLAALVSFFTEHRVDAYIILVVVVANAVLGFVQEYRAEKAISALKSLIDLEAKVYRQGELEKISSKNLVPGDIIALEAGDKIPADARLLKAKKLTTIESALTGESLAVVKNSEPIKEQAGLGERKNMVWSGTLVTEGRGRAVVVATGEQTQFGQIASQMQEIAQEPSHFERQTALLVKQIGLIGLCSSILIFVTLFFWRQIALLDTALFTLAALVAAIPEGLPAILAFTLAIGARRMAQRKAVIRRLSATETLGVVTTICTDKTGTLTENTMTAEKIWLPDGKEIQVTGRGWAQTGQFLLAGQPLAPLGQKVLARSLEVSLLGNQAEIRSVEGQAKIIGDPTEAALVALAHKAGLRRQDMAGEYRLVDQLGFDSQRKYQASLVQNQAGEKFLFVTGAPEKILSLSSGIYSQSTSLEAARPKLLKQIEKYSLGGNRNLGLAWKRVASDMLEVEPVDVRDLEFLSLVAIRDPLRPEVAEAIKQAKASGIRVLMLTGDHKTTAKSIAQEIGLLEPGARCLEERELANLSEAEFAEAVRETAVFARLTPKTKYRITQTLQDQGEIVAMTGDGVNDAPALKRADVGVSMGLVGTDVARESAEIILLDDNFASIVSAVKEGRAVFANVRKSAYYLIATNLAETITILASVLLGLPLPLTASQILWLNLVTDGVNGLAIATEPVDQKTLQTPAKKLDKTILNRKIIPLLISINLPMVSASLLALWLFSSGGQAAGQTAVFIVLSLSQLLNIFNIRAGYESALNGQLLNNRYINLAVLTSLSLLSLALLVPGLRSALGLALPTIDKIGFMLVLALGVFLFVELSKAWLRRRQN
jgi:P-type Ca2+ transporter type 2C